MYAICHPSRAVDVTLAKVQVRILIFLQYLIPSPNKLQLMCEMLPHSRSDCRIYLNPANTFDCRLIFGPLHDYWCVCVWLFGTTFLFQKQQATRPKNGIKLGDDVRYQRSTAAPTDIRWREPSAMGAGWFHFCCVFYFVAAFSQQCPPRSSMVILWEISVRIFVTSCIYYENPQVIGQDDRLGSAFAAARNLVGTTSRIICWQRVLCHVFCATHRFN